RLARKLGMVTYRSAKEWALRFGRERASAERKPGDPFGIDFGADAYLERHATKFTGQYDPNCYLYISRAMDLFDLADHGGTVQAALQRFRVSGALVTVWIPPCCSRSSSSRNWRMAWPRAVATCSSCACRHCRGTTRSLSTWIASVPSSAPFYSRNRRARRKVCRAVTPAITTPGPPSRD